MANTVERGLSAVLVIIAFAALAWAAFGPAAGAAMALATAAGIVLQHDLLKTKTRIPKSRAPARRGLPRDAWLSLLLKRGRGYV